MEIQSDKDFVISVEGQRHQLTITSPYPEDTGVFMVTATNNSGKATSTAHIAVEAASSDEEYLQKTTTSTKVVQQSQSQTVVKQSVKVSKKAVSQSQVVTASGATLPPGINPTDAMKQFANVFASVGGVKKKKVKKPKATSSAETEYETQTELETEAHSETAIQFTETEAEMSSTEQWSSEPNSKVSPAVPKKPSAAELIKVGL